MLRMLLLFFVSPMPFAAGAQSLSLTGKVTNGSGKAVSGAVVSLAGKKLKDTTDAQGAFSIYGGTSVVTSRARAPNTQTILLNNGVVLFSVPQTAPVRIQMLDMKGNLLESAFDRSVGAGNYRFDMRSHRCAAKVMAIRVSVCGSVSTFRWISLTTGSAGPAAVGVGMARARNGVAKIEAVVDTLIVTASGYVSSVRAIESYQGEVNIALDSIALAKFSFFVTSLAGLKRLSSSENGFGGDLRFGKTGKGAGLLGADSICQCLAEASMPGSKVKQWRAFLSVSAGPNGNQVNAIDRIGTGPWYDRLGRLVSNSVSDLFQTRPKGDAAIKNDLPNEYGVPNHRPDPNQPIVDNHQVITGSDDQGGLDSKTSTCQDWTSASNACSSQRCGPRCGLSWPRNNSQSWICAMQLWGCGAGIDLEESTGAGEKGVYTIGNGGGYGGFYCFALSQ
jgi:hypothetical protein